MIYGVGIPTKYIEKGSQLVVRIDLTCTLTPGTWFSFHRRQKLYQRDRENREVQRRNCLLNM
jgi:hypothetical protein